MRPGDWITVNGNEANLLMSDTFKGTAPPDITGNIELTPNTKPGYYRLALPAIGRPVVRALTAFAAGVKMTRSKRSPPRALLTP